MCFSKYFNNYLTRNNISINKLSKATGIDRATLHRYQNGDRLPKNIETVEAIADGLYMNAAERAEFLKEYDKATLGDDIVNSYHFFKNLLQNFSDTKDSVTLSIVSESIRIPETFSATEDTAALYHSHNIIAYVVRMFKQSHDSNGHIMLYMQPTYTQIQELLIPFFSGTDVIIEQLICFEKSIEKYHTNINVLKEVLPQAFTLKNYNVYYYYNNIVNNLNSVSPLPNLMINESCALMFDYEMQSGFFTTNKIIVNYLTEYFNRTKANFFSLIEKGSYIDNLDQLNSAINGRKIVTIFNQPCLGPCLDSKTLKESICQFPLKE
ncbi:MAG: helix-turn-helix transcriptional regulator, partial [Lachnospiraceae bacterium]|nr:helix-turn-helix transcriptional regulator [Lachnospiraceae bacterium]